MLHSKLKTVRHEKSVIPEIIRRRRKKEWSSLWISKFCNGTKENVKANYFRFRCRPSVGGRSCDQCLPGYYGFPHCYQCRCQTSGTRESICDPATATCQCKEVELNLHENSLILNCSTFRTSMARNVTLANPVRSIYQMTTLLDASTASASE